MNEQVTYTSPGLDALGESAGWAAALVVLLAIGTLVAVACGWRERRITPRGWGWLLALRLTAIAAAGLLLVGFERRALVEQERPSRVVLLVDRSASMMLPADPAASEPSSRQAVVWGAAERLAESLRESHAVRDAGFDVVVRYDEEPGTQGVADGASTRLGDALARVLEDHAGAPLAGIVVASDGGWNSGEVPQAAAARAATRGVRIHTLGVGPRELPPNAGLRDLATPSQAAVGDPFRVSVTATATATGQTPSQEPLPQWVAITISPLDADNRPGEPVLNIELTLAPGGTGSADDLRIETPGRYQVAAELLVSEADADSSDNRLTTTLELVDEPTRVLLAASGPSRDYRFLRDQLFRDDQFKCEVLLQSAAGGVTQDADRLLAALPSDAGGWDAYDAFVAVDFDWRETDDEAIDALAEWVASRGGGFVFASSRVSTPASVREGLATRLERLLPVTLRDDPLAVYTSLGAARSARPVTLTPAGRGADFLLPPPGEGSRTSDWGTLGGFYSSPLPADVKPGARVLATLDGDPLFVDQSYGAGRVVYLASAETWRLRRASPDWFTALHTGLLRHVTRGRLLGGDADGTLLLDQTRYAVGDSVTLRYVSRSAETEGAGQLAARLLLGEGDPSEVTLVSTAEQPGVYATSFQAERAGRILAVLETPGGQRLTAEATATLPSLEGETLVQNAAVLRSLAELTGGEYVDLSEADSDTAIPKIVAATPSLAETVTELGPPDRGFAERLATGALVAMVGALVLEWLLRRLWRLA